MSNICHFENRNFFVGKCILPSFPLKHYSIWGTGVYFLFFSVYFLFPDEKLAYIFLLLLYYYCNWWSNTVLTFHLPRMSFENNLRTPEDWAQENQGLRSFLEQSIYKKNQVPGDVTWARPNPKPVYLSWPMPNFV